MHPHRGREEWKEADRGGSLPHMKWTPLACIHHDTHQIPPPRGAGQEKEGALTAAAAVTGGRADPEGGQRSHHQGRQDMDTLRDCLVRPLSQVECECALVCWAQTARSAPPPQLACHAFFSARAQHDKLIMDALYGGGDPMITIVVVMGGAVVVGTRTAQTTFARIATGARFPRATC